MQETLRWLMDEARGMWRFRRAGLIIAWLVCLLGWAVVLWIPSRYEAAARVFVDPSTSLKPVIENLAVQQDVDAELALVRQTLLNDVSLNSVVEKVGLGARDVSDQNRADTRDELRENIFVVQVNAAEPSAQNARNPSKLYTIRYQDPDRDRALRVVALLLDSFVTGTIGGKREGAQQAQRFLESQIGEYETRLSAAEARLAEFKKKNVGLMPTQSGGQQTDYFSRLQAELDAVKKAQTMLNSAYSRREALQQQLRGEAPVAASGGGAVGVNGTSISTGGDTLSRIKETQAKLDDLLLRFTDRHPDVVATRQTLAELQARRASELDALRRGDPNAAAITGASSNPVYQNIQLSLNQVTIEVAAAQSELRDRQQKVAELRRMVDTVPQVEAEFAQLNRDYGVVKQQYDALVDRLEKARVGEQADASGSVRFEVVDPPTADFKPVSLPKPLLSIAVLVLGIGAGLAWTMARNLLSPVYYTLQSLKELTGVTILGAVSAAYSETRMQRQVHDRRYWILALGGLIFVALVVSAISWKYPVLARIG